MFGGGGEQSSCGAGVSDGGGVVDAEHGGEVQRVRSAGECLVELSVDAQRLQPRGPAAERGW